jgi:hypothetical protein
MSDLPPPRPPSGGLAPLEGAWWLKAAWKFFRAQPMRWLGITAAFFLALQLLANLPGVAGIFLFFLKPILAVGFLAAAWHQEKGEAPALQHLLLGFKSNWRALLPLGLFYLVTAVVAVSLASAISGVSVERLMESSGKTITPQVMKEIQPFMLWTIFLMLPTTLALWFAPALIVFDDLKVGQALATSLKACLRNAGLLVIYGIAVIGVVLTLVFLMAIVGTLVPALSMVAALAALLPLTAVILISDYVGFRRVFHGDQPLRLPEPPSRKS